ncbi:unnamed protein product, partial [Pleuronectes platessa]
PAAMWSSQRLLSPAVAQEVRDVWRGSRVLLSLSTPGNSRAGPSRVGPGRAEPGRLEPERGSDWGILRNMPRAQSRPPSKNSIT